MTEKKTTTKKPTIYERIHAVMKDLKYIQKGEKKVNGQYSFAGHDKVTSEVRKHLVTHGIVVVPSVTSHSQDGNRTVVDIETAFINVDNPDDKVVINFFGYGVDNQDKGPGKAFSYAKKYAFLQLFCLETGDDPEKDLIDYDEGAIDSKQAAQIDEWMDQTGTKLDDFLQVMKIKLVDELPAGRFDEVRAIFMKKIDKMKGVA
jgi:hypothetical protein